MGWVVGSHLVRVKFGDPMWELMSDQRQQQDITARLSLRLASSYETAENNNPFAPCEAIA